VATRPTIKRGKRPAVKQPRPRGGGTFARCSVSAGDFGQVSAYERSRRLPWQTYAGASAGLARVQRARPVAGQRARQAASASRV